MPRPTRFDARLLAVVMACALLAACQGRTATSTEPDAEVGAEGLIVDVGVVGRDAGLDGRDAGLDGRDAGLDGRDAGLDGRDADADRHDAEARDHDVDADGRDADRDAPEAVPDGGDVVPDGSDVAVDGAEGESDGDDVAVDGGDVAVDGGDVVADECPLDPDKVAPGACGCGVPDTPNCAELEPPAPDPLAWVDAPHATGATSIAMTAEAAADPSGVEYAFDCVAGPCHDSGWRDGATYEDTGLAPDQPYAYRVRARDKSPNQNATAWSAEALATTERDPGFAAGLEARFFDLVASGPGLPELGGLTADVARIDPQIAYPPTTEPWPGLGAGFADTFASRHAGFLRIDEPGEVTLILGAEGAAKVWLDAEVVLDSAGPPGPTAYSFVRTLATGYHPLRVDFYEDADLAGLTLWYEGPGVPSQVVPAWALYHADPPDLAPPSPSPSQWAALPAATGPHSVSMAAAVAADVSGVQYFFECALGGGHDSGWQTGRTYADVGLPAGSRAVYRVRTRDLSVVGSAGVASPPVSVTTDTYVPSVVGLTRSQALVALVVAALVAGDVTAQFSATVPVDGVLDQSPAAGTLLPAGSKVALVVSQGPDLVDVPDVAGQPLASAWEHLVAAGLKVGEVGSAASCSVEPGRVVGQVPGGGESVPRGSGVNLVVSKGPEQVVISELLYNPSSDLARDEFLELFNPCAWPVALEGWTIEGLAGFSFGPGASIAAGGYVVLAEDAVAFQAAFGLAPDFVYAGPALSNRGELLRVLTGAGDVADEVTYDDVPPWPVTPDGLGPSLEVVDPAEDNDTPRNWRASVAPSGATPRAVNSVDADGLPPWITEVGHAAPEAELPLTVTALVADATAVTLTYVLDWGVPESVSMADDGQSGDGDEGDGVFGAILPGLPVGTLVRYRLDAVGATGSMGYPRDDDTVRYTGTYLAPPSSSDLDIFHWLIEPEAYARALEHYATNQTEPALLFHQGVLYDGLEVRVRGQSSRGWPKKHWNVKFARGHGFAAATYTPVPVSGFNLQSSYADKSYLRELLSYETFRDAGSPSHIIAPVTVVQNGQFFGLYNYLEDMDAAYLERNGLDPEGGFYKAFGSQCEAKPLEALPGPWEKETPDDGDFTELFELLCGVDQPPGPARRDFLFDAIDLPSLLTYQAVSVLIHNNDQVAKNYFLYRDGNRTGRWSMHAWDMDLTFGRSYQGKVLNDELFATTDAVEGRPNVAPSHPLFGDSEHQKWDYLWNRLTDVVLEEPDLRQMYYRRLRSLLDELLVDGRFEARLAELAPLIADEAEQDRQKWGWYGLDESPALAIERLKQEYLAPRRTHLFVTHRIEGEIPPAQALGPVVVVNELMYNPFVDPEDPTDPGDELEFIELYNPSPVESVDVSGWRLTGVGLTIPYGAVLLPDGYLLVVRNDVAFRQRYGPGHFLAGQYDGKLDGGGEVVRLLDRAGAVVDEVTYDDVAPWPTAPDGQGPSLELLDPAQDNSLPAAWAASQVIGGTPGAVNSVR